MHRLDSNQFDVDTAFLYGELEEKIYKELPEGYADYLEQMVSTVINYEELCVLLLKAIYGLIQVARQWWKKFKKTLLKLGYRPSASDPCLFFKKNKCKDMLTITFCVYDGGCIGTKEVIASILEGLSQDFAIKVLGPLKNYVGSNLIEEKANQQMWIT